jgi:spore coat protein CotF
MQKTQSNQSRMENATQNPQVPPMMNHGAHEVHDVHEVLSGMIGAMDQYLMLRQQVQDPELVEILDRQYQFIEKEYNTLVECFSTGRDPTQSTVKYKMKQGNNVVYGSKPSQPKKPMTSASEFNDQRISGQMLGLMKAMASDKARAACEVTNPVVRRVIADSIPNCIEMAYEIFLYQNKHGYYQVPQLPQNEMQQLVSAYAPANRQASTERPLQ